MEKIRLECPRCRGERGHIRDGVFVACITCKTKGEIMVASQAEARRIECMVTDPQKVRTLQREKEK